MGVCLIEVLSQGTIFLPGRMKVSVLVRCSSYVLVFSRILIQMKVTWKTTSFPSKKNRIAILVFDSICM